jgi:hypothetical protein
MAAVESVVLPGSALYGGAVTSMYGLGPATLAFPPTVNDEGEKLPGLKFDVVSVPLIVVFPATLRLPPSVSPNAEISFPVLVELTSGARITSG